MLPMIGRYKPSPHCNVSSQRIDHVSLYNHHLYIAYIQQMSSIRSLAYLVEIQRKQLLQKAVEHTEDLDSWTRAQQFKPTIMWPCRNGGWVFYDPVR